MADCAEGCPVCRNTDHALAYVDAEDELEAAVRTARRNLGRDGVLAVLRRMGYTP